MPATLPASYPVRADARMDPVRILGYSSAIAINLIAAGLLILPIQAPPPAPPPDPRPVWILPATPTPPVPPPPVTMPRPPEPAPRVATSPAVVPTPPLDAPVLLDQGTLPPSLPVTPTRVASIEPAPAGAGPAPMTLEYAFAPPPPYPRDSVRNGDEGTVLLQVLVDVDGRPLAVEIVEGSGHRELDKAARRHVLANWRFRPATRDGRPVQAIGLVPIEFSLD